MTYYFNAAYNKIWGVKQPTTNTNPVNPSETPSKTESKGGWLPSFNFWQETPKIFNNTQEETFLKTLQTPFSSTVFWVRELLNFFKHKQLNRSTLNEFQNILSRIDPKYLEEHFKDTLSEQDIQNIQKLQKAFETSDSNSLFQTGMELESFKSEITTLLEEGTGSLNKIQKKTDEDLSKALQHLLTYFTSYLDKNERVQLARELLEKHISNHVFIFSFEENLILKEGIKALSYKNSSSKFLSELLRHMAADPVTARELAYQTLFAFSSELELLDQQKIKEKINTLNKENGNASPFYLPKEVSSYLAMIGPSEVFERFFCRGDQHQALRELNQLCKNFAEGKEDSNSSAKNTLREKIEQTARYLYDPRPLEKKQPENISSSSKAPQEDKKTSKEEDLGIWDKIKVIQGVTSTLTSGPSSSSDTSSLDKVLQILDKADPLFPVLKDLVPLLQELARDKKEPSAIDKIDGIILKLNDYKGILSGLIPLLTEITKDTGKTSAVDKIDGIVEKLKPFKEPLTSLIPLLTKLTEDKKDSTPTAIDKLNTLVDNITPHVKVISDLNQVMLKMLDEKLNKDPSAVDKVLTIVEKISPLITTLDPLIKKMTDSSDKGPSVIDQCLILIAKTADIVTTLNPLIKQLSEKTEGKPTIDKVEGIVDKVDPIVKSLVPILIKLTSDTKSSDPSALAKTEIILDKFIPVFDKLHPILKKLTEDSASKEKSSIDKLDQLLDKSSTLFKALEPILIKLTDDKKSSEPSAIDKFDTLVSKIAPHVKLIESLNQTLLKMLEEKVDKEPSAVDKITKIVEKVAPIVATLDPLIKKMTDSSDKGPSALDQCLSLIDKTTGIVTKLDPLIKQLTEKTEGKTSIDKVEGIVDKVDPIVKSLVPILTKLTSDSKSSDPSAFEKAEKILDKFVPLYEKLHPILEKLTTDSSSKEPNSIDKLDKLLEKSSSLIKTLEPLIKKLSEPSSSEESSLDKASRLLDKMSPIVKTTSELIPLITKLTTEQNTSHPSSMEKVDGMITKLNDLASKLSAWLPIVQKMTEPSSEPSSIDKINTALDKLNKAIESCSKMLEGVTEMFGGKKSSSSSGPSALKKAAESLQALVSGPTTRENIQAAFNELQAITTTVPTEIGKTAWELTELNALNEVKTQLQAILSHDPVSIDEPTQKKIKDLLTVTLSSYLSTPLEKVLDNVGDILAKVAAHSASKAGELIASQMGSQLAVGLNIILEEAKKRILGLTPSSTYQPLVNAIDGLMGEIQKAETNGSWKQLYEAFMSFKEAAKSLPPLAINGMIFSFDSKKPSSTERSPFATALTNDPQGNAPSSPQSYEALQQVTDLQKQEFVRNTANLLVIKNVYETVCGILPNDPNFYTDLIEKAHEETKNDPKKFGAVIRSKFFQKIDEAHRDGKILLITKWFSKLVFRIMLAHAESWISKISTRFIDHIRTVIIQRNEKGFAQFKNGLVDNFNSYLGALGDAFKNALSNDTVHSHLNAKIEAELKKPSYNHGYTTEDLYREAAKKAVETFMADISWTASIADWFKKHRLEDTSLPKRAVNECASLVSGILRLTVWGPQKLVNFLFIRRLKKSLIQSNGIDTLVNKSIDSVIDKNGYTHALNCVIRDQLKEVLERLKNGQNPDSKEDPSQSNFQKKELARLVTNLLEVLDKSRCMTSDQLEAFLKNKTIPQKAQEALDNLFIPSVVDSTVKVINAAYESVMNKEQLEKQLCNFMSLVNKTYESSKEVDAAEVKRTENEITQLTDSILEITINDAIKTKFDHFTDTQTTTINEYSSELQKGIKEYSGALQTKLDELRRRFADHNCSGAKDLLTEIRTDYDKFIKDCDQKFFFKIAGNKEISTPMKNQLKILSETTAVKCKGFRDSMLQLLSMEEKLFRGEKVDNYQTLEQQLLDQMFNAKNALLTWSDDKQFQPIAPMQFSFAQWNWFMDFVKNIVYSRVKERADGLIEFMRLPYNYRYGIFHHLLLIPFVGRKK